MRTFSFGASMLSNKQRSTPVACSEKIAKLTPLPSQVAPSGYGFPGQVSTVVIKRDVVISHAKTTRNPRLFARLAELVAEKNGQQTQTDRSRNHERARRRFWHGA